MALSNTVWGSGRKKPPTTSREGSSSSGRVSSSSHWGTRDTPASVLAMICPQAALMASFLPWEILAPSRTSSLMGRSWSLFSICSTVPSVEPPSTMTTSEGRTVCRARECSSPSMEAASSLTVTMTETSLGHTVLFGKSFFGRGGGQALPTRLAPTVGTDGPL